MFAALFVLRPLLIQEPGAARPSRRTMAYCAIAVAGLLAGALGLYSWWGTPAALTASSAAARPAAPHTTSNPAAAPGTMEEATRRLAARLAAGGGSAEDWRLLAKSYEFLGRAEEARRATSQADALAGAAPKVSPASAPAMLAAAAPAAPAAPPDAATVRDLTKAEQLRRARDYAGACAIYARLAARSQLNADGWADYADASASLHGGSLQGEPAGYIDQALRLDPQHPKALWLEASLAHEQHRYADAIVQWRRLAAALPPDSPDQRIVAANIEEATRLAGSSAPPPPAAVSNSNTARIAGTVELAAPLAARAPAGATLFIYARSPDAGGPPLAVLRVPANHWPVAFVLDDSQSMIPGRVLSGASAVRVEARISRSGNALPQPGDLVGTVSNIDPHAGRTVRIAIDHEIG
jgi:cytochrome c-type biogenesis protein CcmH